MLGLYTSIQAWSNHIDWSPKIYLNHPKCFYSHFKLLGKTTMLLRNTAAAGRSNTLPVSGRTVSTSISGGSLGRIGSHLVRLCSRLPGTFVHLIKNTNPSIFGQVHIYFVRLSVHGLDALIR